jgi:hypothetical protein
MRLLSEVDSVVFDSFDFNVVKFQWVVWDQLLAWLYHNFNWMNRFFLSDRKWLIDQNENIVCLHVYYAHTDMIDV